MTPRSKLLVTAARTFEQLAFLSIVDERPAYTDNLTWMQVPYSGPFTGALYLGAAPDVALAVADNMLGEEMMPTVEQQWDALGEVANVICGNALAELYGAQNVFDLGRPTRIAPPQQIAGEQAAFQLDAGPVWVGMETHGATGAPS